MSNKQPVPCPCGAGVPQTCVDWGKPGASVMCHTCERRADAPRYEHAWRVWNDRYGGQTIWTDEMKARCRGRCGDVGDPPCYELHRLTSTARQDEILPCDACLFQQEETA